MGGLGSHVRRSDDRDHVLLVPDFYILLPKEEENEEERGQDAKFRRFGDCEGVRRRYETTRQHCCHDYV